MQRPAKKNIAVMKGRNPAVPLSKNEHLLRWVEKMAELAKPASIHWVDGSQEENEALRRQMVASGTLIKLNEKLWPGCYYARSDANDVARVEDRTFICSLSKDTAGPTNNWENPYEMRKKLKSLFNGAMRGRTMYVLGYSMGPFGSPMSQIGVQLTDSPYVVVNMRIMARIGMPVFQQWKTLGPGIDESCWKSLPPTLCFDALGGRLARRWGGLLRLLRLPRLGLQARFFIHLNPFLARDRRDQLANRFERQLVRRLEMNATLPHVELLPRRFERRLQLLELTRTPKRAHQVERAVVFLRRERDVADRLLVVSVWISRQGDRPPDRAPDEALIVAARNVLVHKCAHRRDRLRTIGGERGDVLRWGLDVRWWFHGFVVFANEVYHRTFENQPAAGADLRV